MVIPILLEGYDGNDRGCWVKSPWIFQKDEDPCYSWSRGLKRKTAVDCMFSAEQLRAQLGENNVVIAMDQYQDDWTFEVLEPPNPVCVDSEAPTEWTRRNDEQGSDSFCWEPGLNGTSIRQRLVLALTLEGLPSVVAEELCDLLQIEDDADFFDSCTDESFTVSQHGTFAFPYGTVSPAIQRVDPERNAGWTVLLKAGRYRENLTIDKKVTLRAADADWDAEAGTVFIGQ
jgi:hypothetical protein